MLYVFQSHCITIIHAFTLVEFLLSPPHSRYVTYLAEMGLKREWGFKTMGVTTTFQYKVMSLKVRICGAERDAYDVKLCVFVLSSLINTDMRLLYLRVISASKQFNYLFTVKHKHVCVSV